MRPVITATDFSEVATNAVQYACLMAAQYNLPVIVLHAYIIPVAFHENPMPVISLEESKSIAESQLKALTEDLFKQYPQLSITGKVVYGDVTDNLKEIVVENNAWMVVVGNSSADDSGFWLGSNLLSTLRHISCPVLAVPAAYQYKTIEKIAFACDLNNISNLLPAADMVALVSQANASLHVINVDHENKNFDAETSFEYASLHESLKAIAPVYHNVDSADIDQALQTFVTEKSMDWLIVIPHKHTFFESLFHKSQTKAIVRHAHIPIVALHEKG